MAEADNPAGNAEAMYQRLQKGRNSVLTAARAAAKVTIPGLIPEEGGSDPHDVLEQPWTSMGARGVNNVSAKLLVTLFPARTSVLPPRHRRADYGRYGGQAG